MPKTGKVRKAATAKAPRLSSTVSITRCLSAEKLGGKQAEAYTCVAALSELAHESTGGRSLLWCARTEKCWRGRGPKKGPRWDALCKIPCRSWQVGVLNERVTASGTGVFKQPLYKPENTVDDIKPASPNILYYSHSYRFGI